MANGAPASLYAAQAALSLVMALALSHYATPLAREAALRFGIVDRPDGKLKTHREPVPYLGGLAIYGAFLVSMALSLTLGFDRRVLGLCLGGSILVIVGLVDDLGSLHWGAKLLGELVAALVAVRSGIAVQLHYAGAGPLSLTLNAALSVLWLLLLTNAANLVDIMDGLAAGVGIVASAALMVVAFLNGRLEILCATAALCGALMGFWRHNRHPASIFMGDAGALFLGFMLGALSLVGSYTARNRLGFLTPLFVLSAPLFDTALVSIIRLSRGASPFRGSPDHFALRLHARGMSVTSVVRATTALSAALAAAGVVNLFVPERASLWLVSGLALALAAAALWLWRVAPSAGVDRVP